MLSEEYSALGPNYHKEKNCRPVAGLYAYWHNNAQISDGHLPPEYPLYNDPAIIIVKENPDAFPLLCLLAIFNSKLATFYHFNSSPKATKGAFPKILVYDVKNFPLPKQIDKTTQEKIESLVDQILIMKSQSKSAQTSDLENQIDQLVYKLYDLTDEEIAIIENS